ncbi:DUF3551 domain-containing protein [Bradyrhizobium sp.]
MAQCRAAASGRRMTCISNPFYKGRRSSASPRVGTFG